MWWNNNPDIDARLIYRHDVPYLVAAFYNSADPVVWQVMLDKESCLSLDLRDDGDHTVLALKNSSGADVARARFIARTDAEMAFDVVRDRILSVGVRLDSGLRWVLILGGTLLLSMLILGHLQPKDNMGPLERASREMSEKTAGEKAEPGVFKKGVPMPADQFLVPPADD